MGVGGDAYGLGRRFYDRKIGVENDEIVWEQDPEVLKWYGGRGDAFHLLVHQIVACGLDGDG